MTDWESVLKTRNDKNVVTAFAEGMCSGRQLTLYFAGKNPQAGVVRNLLRTYGVDHARNLAGKALSRRQLV